MPKNLGRAFFNSTEQLLNLHKKLLKRPFSLLPSSSVPFITTPLRPDPKTRGRWKRHVFISPAISQRILLSKLDYYTFTPSLTSARTTTQGMSLVVMLHGCTQNAYSFAQGTLMNKVAQANGFVVLYPQQSKRYQLNSCWRWFLPDERRGLAEADTIMEIIDTTISMYGLDPEKVFMAGLSAGAAMASLVAARHPDRFRAIAMHSGPILGKAHNLATGLETMKASDTGKVEDLIEHLAGYTVQHNNLPAMIIHGVKDDVVNINNAQQLTLQFLHLNELPTDAEPKVSLHYAGTPREYTHRTFKDKHHNAVELVEVKHLNHAWSGGDDSLSYNSRKGPNSSHLIWNFFSRCARQYDLWKLEQTPLPPED